MEFQVEKFKVERLCEKGVWLVTTNDTIDLAMLFLRAQEFYENPSDQIRGKSFTIAQFMKIYAERIQEQDKSAAKVFSYCDDFRAFNIPKTAIDEFQKLPILDLNENDVLFARIVQGVRCLQGGDFYLIGAQTGHVPNTQHEIAHAMYYFMAEYRETMDALIANMEVDNEFAYAAALMAMDKEGYSEVVWQDEIQAYFATGLFSELEEYEHLRDPFMKAFYKFKKRLMRKKSKKKVKMKVQTGLVLGTVAVGDVTLKDQKKDLTLTVAV